MGVSRECAEHINSSCGVLVEVVLDVVALKQFLAELGDHLCGLYPASVGEDNSEFGPPQSHCPVQVGPSGVHALCHQMIQGTTELVEGIQKGVPCHGLPRTTTPSQICSGCQGVITELVLIT